MNRWIGTSGFQYAEWKGTFYPEDLSAAKMLPYYAERLSTTEINYTFRRIPSAKRSRLVGCDAGTLQVQPESAAKGHPFAKLRNCGDTLRYFHQVISDLETKLGVVLFQLPPAFKKDAAILAAFLRMFPRNARGFEFRHASWFDDEFSSCSGRRISRFASRTVKSWPRRSWRRPTTVTCVCAAKIIRTADVTDGRRRSRRRRSGQTRSSTSSTKKAGSARNWPATVRDAGQPRPWP